MLPLLTLQLSSESEVEEELNLSSSDDEDTTTTTSSIARVNSSDYFVLEFKGQDRRQQRVVSASPAVRVASPAGMGSRTSSMVAGSAVSMTETQQVRWFYQGFLEHNDFSFITIL